MKFQSRPKAPKLELHSAAGTAREPSINFYSVYVSLGWNYVVKGEKWKYLYVICSVTCAIGRAQRNSVHRVPNLERRECGQRSGEEIGWEKGSLLTLE